MQTLTNPGIYAREQATQTIWALALNVNILD